MAKNKIHGFHPAVRNTLIVKWSYVSLLVTCFFLGPLCKVDEVVLRECFCVGPETGGDWWSDLLEMLDRSLFLKGFVIRAVFGDASC